MKKILSALVAALLVSSFAFAGEDGKVVWDIAPVGGSATCKATRDTAGGPITLQADAVLSGGQAPVIATSTSRVMIASGTCTNMQTNVLFGVAFSAAPKVFLQWAGDASLQTGAIGVGTNDIISAVSISATSFVPKSGVQPGGMLTNIVWFAIGSD
jgi:hypothetical protein